MSCILLLETATKICSVGLAENCSATKAEGKLIALKESHSANSHSSLITSFIQEVILSSGKKLTDIDAVCLSMGPGSYTGLRIGVSTAKGLCYALNKPLIAVNTLQAMALQYTSLFSGQIENNTILCPMIDARRMEVYTALFDIKGNFIKETSAEIITEDSFSEMLSKKNIIFFGDGSEKCKEMFKQSRNAIFSDHFENSVKGMLRPAFEKLNHGQFENTAYFEPYYLKDFLATKPKKLL